MDLIQATEINKKNFSFKFQAYDTETEAYVGAIVCKLDYNNKERRQGYVAMLAVDESCRRLGVGENVFKISLF